MPNFSPFSQGGGRGGGLPGLRKSKKEKEEEKTADDEFFRFGSPSGTDSDPSSKGGGRRQRPPRNSLSRARRHFNATYSESEIARVSNRHGRERDDRALGSSGRGRRSR